MRENMMAELSRIKNLTLIPSETNFLLVRAKDIDLQKQLLLKGIFIRSCENIEGLGKGYFRFAVKDKEANNVLFNTIKSITEK